MRVFVAGATGVLGRRLVRELTSRGHSVIGLARDERGARLVAAAGGTSRLADLLDGDSLARVAEGSDVVIHAATAIPKKTKPRSADWALNDRIRHEGTMALARCASLIGAKAYVQQSVVWVCRPAGGGIFDEQSPAHPDKVTRSAWEGENLAREAGERHGYAVSILRCGSLYAADSWHTRTLARGLRARTLPLIGGGTAHWSCLHADDAAGAFATAAERPRADVWHVVDDEPVRVGDFLTYLAQRLGADRPRKAPRWLARIVAGAATVNFFTTPTITSNRKFRDDFAWSPRYSTYRQGLDQVVGEWRAAGFPERR